MIAIREIFLKLKRTFVCKKFIEFCFLGVFNTLNHAFLTMVLSETFQVQDNVAYAIGYIISLAIAFILSSYIIFKKPTTWKGFFKFYVSYIPSIIIGVLVSFITIQVMQLTPFWATIVAAAIGAPVTFVIMKIFTFRGR